jgi:hypothetical protein
MVIGIDATTMREVHHFPTTIDHPEYGIVTIVDYVSAGEYIDGYYAAVAPDTFQYEAMIREDDTEVRLVENTDQ